MGKTFQFLWNYTKLALLVLKAYVGDNKKKQEKIPLGAIKLDNFGLSGLILQVLVAGYRT